MHRILLVLLGTLVISKATCQLAVELDPVISGLTNPVDIANCGDDRLFIVERAGVIRILRPNHTLAPTPFLDISGPVNSAGGEQGMLGLAFHPQYAQNGFFYVYYCTGTGNGSVRVSRFTVSANPDVATAASESVIWQLSQPFSNHKGGQIAFGPDGYLYFAPGDGGDGGDPGNRAQNMGLGYGKVHRIDVSSGSPYTIPPTNPFATADNVDTLRTIWASGLRNPYRFSFDPPTGDLWIGDVGQNAREEVDRIAANANTGPNFGWRCYEGTVAYNTAGCAGIGAYAAPMVDHDQAGGWCSVIAGRVYRGTRYPLLAGRFIYTDYCHGRIQTLHQQGPLWIQDTLLNSGIFGFSGFGQDVLGELYVCNTSSGYIYRITEPTAVVRLSPKVNLEGPYDMVSSTMTDGLRASGLLPLTEPYTGLGMIQVADGGGETTTQSVFNTTGNNAVVDWVHVELRPSGRPTMIAATRQGLLQRDGDIVATDNVSALTFNVGPGSYYVVVRHRNHLGVMTASPLSLTATASTVDLRSTAVANYGTNAQKVIGAVHACWGGDLVRDATVKYTGAANDRDPILVRVGGTTPTNTATGYFVEDMNLDGVVKYTGVANDRDPILVNIGGTVPTATRLEQVP